MKFRTVIVLAAAAGLSAASSARALTVGELQEKMRSSESSVRTMQFRYVQEMRSSLANEVRISSGTVYLRKPRDLRIEQSGPERQLIVASGKSVFVYTPRFKQVLKDSWDRWIERNTFFPGLSGFSDTLQKLTRDYRWEIRGDGEIDGEKTLQVTLHRKGEGEPADHLDLWLGEADFIPRKTELVSGTLKLTTTVAALRVNPGLDAGLFKFEPPAGTGTIEMP